MESDAFRAFASSAIHDRYAIVEAPSHPDALKLLAFWDARPADGIVMGRDIPSRAVARLLSGILISEPIDGRSDFRVRLAGASLRKRFGRDVKGLKLSEMFSPAEFQDHLKTGLMAIESCKPFVIDSRLIAGTVEQMHLEVVQFPVIAPDRKSKWLLVGLFYLN